MTITMYQASVPACARAMHNLERILKKGEAYAVERRIDPAVILNSRLALDMFPLLRQVQVASDTAKGAGARLAGIEVPRFEDTEQGFADLYKRIDRTLEFLSSIEPAQVDGSEDRTIVLKLHKEVRFTGIDYLFGFALPNLAFHVATAYGILRHAGVPLGKADYLGELPAREGLE